MKHIQAGVFSQMLAPADGSTAVRTANVDCAGYDYATIVVGLGAEANTNSTNVAVALLESDDTVATNFANVAASTYNQTIDNTSATEYVLHVDLKGRKRYLRISVTPDTHTTNGVVNSAAYAILAPENPASSNSSNADNVAVG